MLGDRIVLLAIFLIGLVDVALAAPFWKRAGVTPVPASVVSSFDVYTQLTRAAYYPGLATWKCGPACDAVPGVVPYASGGDGQATPFWFVGYLPANNSVVITHEGTRASSYLSWLNDAKWFQDPMDAYFFPGVPAGVKVHGGFQGAFGRAITEISDAVQTAITARSATRLVIVGHSLGGAIALLDSVYFHIKLPSLTIKTVTYGAPRVGNPAFADYVKGYDLTRITNKQDVVPTTPGKVFAYLHPHGEIHINATGHWNYCDGQDNDDIQCSAGQVDSVADAVLEDHSGPYNGITM